MIERIRQRVENVLWDPRVPTTSWPMRFMARLTRFPYALVRDALGGELTLRAMSLVYTTLLAIVPLIAFSFSVLKAFDFHRQVQPLLYSFLAPLGDEGINLTNQVMEFVENVQGVALGSLGLALLIWTVVTMIQKIEEAFNYVWQVQRPRSIGRRFSEYLSVILIAPVLLATALGLKGTAENTSIARWLLDIDVISDGVIFFGQFMPYLLIVGAFSFLYGFIPNTRVRITSALVGGLAGGLTWSFVGALFASFVSASTRYQAIYSSFAIPLLALIWLYISWLIVLLGARVSYYYQHPEYLRRGRDRIKLTNRLRERLALAVMYYVGQEFRNERPHWTVNTLATHLGIPADSLAEIIHQLESRRLLVVTEDDVMLPGRDTECLPLNDIIDAVRRDPSERQLIKGTSLQRVDHVVAEIETAVDEHLAGRSLRDLIENPSTTAQPGSGSAGEQPAADKITGLYPRG